MPAYAQDVVESEKITLNLGHVDLGRIDLLVREGFFANRTDVMRSAIRALLDRHDDTLRRTATRAELDLGIRRIGRAELETALSNGTPLRIRVLGLAIIAPDVDPDLACAAIAEFDVLGTLQAPADVKAAMRRRPR